MAVGKSAAKKTPNPAFQQLKTVAAPVGGLNVVDPISNMPETDAYDLINWIPEQYGCRVRKGYAEWATGMGSSTTIRSIFNYFPNTASISTTATYLTAPTTLPGTVHAATDAAIYNITSSGAVGASVVTLSGTTNAGAITSVNFSNSAGTWLLFCSETDGYYTYDGTTYTKVTLGGGGTQVSVGDPTAFCFVTIWKRRAWFVQKSSSKVWYLAADAIYGAATALDLGAVFPSGGGVAWIANWTIDAGTGIDDHLVICSENGDLALYKGTDPSSATTFALVGVWNVGEVPKGRRGFCMYGGDLLVLSNLGLAPISEITRGGSGLLAASGKDYNRKISPLMSEVMSGAFNSAYGFELLLHPRENLLFLSIPDSTLATSTQYVMSAITGSWTSFFSMPVQTMCLVGGWLLFGTTDGRVCIYGTTYTDGDTIAGGAGSGSPIVSTMQCAFNSFGSPGQLKHFLMTRMQFLANQTPAVSTSMNVDFQTVYPGSAPALGPSNTPGKWDTGLWDSARWGTARTPYSVWQSAPAYGYYGSVTMLTSTQDDTLLTSIDYVYELGNPL